MTPRHPLLAGRLIVGAVSAVLLVTSLVIPTQSVRADINSVTIEKTTSASGTQSPGDTFTYTIRVTTHAAVDRLRLADGAFDYPQVAITNSLFTVNGGAPRSCGTPRPDNIWCGLGNVPAGTTIVATVTVQVNPNVDVACDKPAEHGTLDSTLRNTAKARWEEAGTNFTKDSARITVNLNCAGYDPTALPTPTTAILTGPAASTTSNRATFTFSASPGVTSYRCALDTGAFSTCTSPKSYAGLSLGSHTFFVQGVNGTGPGVPASRQWTAASPFTDVGGSNAFGNDIFWLYNEGITAGCSAGKFCPRAGVTREQMASFLVRALDLPTTSTDFFTDDESSAHESDINRLAASGITGGCGPGRFCPRAAVTREQMASFLARAFHLPGSPTDHFNDDESSIHENDINRLAQSGITGGCGTGRFCPRTAVSREQMAAFLHRALTR